MWPTQVVFKLRGQSTQLKNNLCESHNLFLTYVAARMRPRKLFLTKETKHTG